MRLNLWRRREQLDHSELSRLLSAPGAPVLPHDRQLLLEEKLMDEIQQYNSAAVPAIASPARSPRRLAVRLATSMAVAAAAAGTFFALNPSTSPVAGHPPAVTSVATSTDMRISNVAYTLQKESGGSVKVIVHANATMDTAQLQKDLAKVGIKATVTEGEEGSLALQIRTRPPRDKHGDYVVTVFRNKREAIGFKFANGYWVDMNVIPSTD